MHEFLTLECVIGRLPRNIYKELPLLILQKRADLLCRFCIFVTSFLSLSFRGRSSYKQSWWKLVQWRLAGFILGRCKLRNCICCTNTVSWTWCVTTVWFIMWISTFVWSR